MGKSNRIKNERATDTLAAPMKKRSGSKGMPTWVGTLIVVAVLVVLVLCVTLAVLNSRGTFKRMRVIAETEHYKITVPMMSYMVYTEYQNLVSTYDQFSQQFGTTISIPGGTGGDKLDTSVALRDQVYSVTTDENGNEVKTTWFDHFVELAKADIASILACCEAAYEEKIELDSSEKEAIELSLENLELYAEYYNYTSSAYFAAMYGEGVNKGDVRKMMRLSQLASKYNTVLSERFMEGVSDEQVEEEYNGNKSKYDTFIDYVGYSFTASFSPATASDNAATVNEERVAVYKKLQEEYKKAVDTLNGCTVDNFETTLKAELERVFEWEAALKKGKDKTPDDLTEGEKAEAEKKAVEATGAARVDNYDTSDATLDDTINTWMKSTTDPRKAGDIKKTVEEKDEYGNDVADSTASDSEELTSATSTYSIYMTRSALHRDSGVVRSVAHILFKTDTYKDLKDITTLSAPLQKLAERVLEDGGEITAETMAKAMLAMMEDEGKISKETAEDGRTYYAMEESVFEAYGNSYTEDSNVKYDNVTEGQMVAQFENWMFDDSRVVGEITYPEAILTDYGYHIMLYRGDEKPSWSHSIRVSLAEGDYEEWLEGAKETYKVTYDERAKLWDMIAG